MSYELRLELSVYVCLHFFLFLYSNFLWVDLFTLYIETNIDLFLCDLFITFYLLFFVFVLSGISSTVKPGKLSSLESNRSNQSSIP